jgi:hypothetical protein
VVLYKLKIANYTYVLTSNVLVVPVFCNTHSLLDVEREETELDMENMEDQAEEKGEVTIFTARNRGGFRQSEIIV